MFNFPHGTLPPPTFVETQPFTVCKLLKSKFVFVHQNLNSVGNASALLNAASRGVQVYITIHDEVKLSSKKSFNRSYPGATTIRREIYSLGCRIQARDDLSDQNVSIVLHHDEGTPKQTK